MKIAMYKRGDYELIHIADHWIEDDPGYIRTTEIVDVALPALPPEIMVPREIAQLDLMEKELTDKHLKALDAIQTKRKDLLALAPPTLVASEVA